MQGGYSQAMARNLRNRTRHLDGKSARELLMALIIYLESLESLMAKSDTLPVSTKHVSTCVLEEIDYLLGIYRQPELSPQNED